MDHILTTWLLTYAAHVAMFTALAIVAERTRWGAVASRRDALWKLALVGGIVTSTVFVAVGSAPSGAAVRLSPPVANAPALDGDGVVWLATGWMAITALLALRAGRAWRLGIRHVGRRRVIRRGVAPALLREILGPAADRVTLSCSRTLGVPVAFAREICVPVRALRELPHDELRALLAHEAAHVVRRDAAWLRIAAAVRALGWWQPLNLVAAGRLRLAMELCCDERAAANPPQRAALARCLIKVAKWNLRDDAAMLATMASRGSALRRRLESLLDDAPRRRRRVGPWVAVTTVAVPLVCLSPVVTIASLSRVPAAAIGLVMQPHASEALGAPAVPLPGRARSRTAARSSKPIASAPIAPSDGRGAFPAIALDVSAQTKPLSMPAVLSPRHAATPAPVPTPLRDAIAAARVRLEPAPSRMMLDVPDPNRGVLGWIARVGTDTTRPSVDAPKPSQRALSWIAQQPRPHTTRPK